MSDTKEARVISKILSSNDTGVNGSHQAGMLIPKKKEILTFFPSLDNNMKNPRVVLMVTSKLDGAKWKFSYIYYNCKYFGGTRNEFRLTGMTQYIKSSNLKPGDEIILEKENHASMLISFRKSRQSNSLSGKTIKLTNEWKVIKF